MSSEENEALRAWLGVTGTSVAPRGLELRPPGEAPALPTVSRPGRPAGETKAARRVLGQQRQARGERGRNQGHPRHCPLSRARPCCPHLWLPPFLPWITPGMLPRWTEPPDSQQTPSQQQECFRQECPGKGLGPPLPLT